MNFNEVPVVDNSFSLPRNVFERALATQARVSITAPSSAGFVSPFLKDSTARHIAAGQQQLRRTSGDYLAGSEAKRPRLSPPTVEQDTAQRMRVKKLQREQFKLQILRRLDHTKDNILKLLKLQHMQGLVHRYEKDPQNRASSFQRSKTQYHSRQGSAHDRLYGTPNLASVQNDPRPVPVSLEQNVRGANNMHVNAQGMHGQRHIPSSTHHIRRVPGINVVTSGTHSSEQKTSYSYKTTDSVGLAWDHKVLPKIVAVHSMMKDKTIDAAKTVLHPSFPPAQTKSSYAVGRHDYADGESGLHNQLMSPDESLQCRVNDRATAVANCEDDEVVLTKVIPGRKPRRSRNTERKSLEEDSTNCNDPTGREAGCSLNGGQVNGHSFETRALNASCQTKGVIDHEHSRSSAGHVEHPGHFNEQGTVNDTGHVGLASHANSELVEKMELSKEHANTNGSVTSDSLSTCASRIGSVDSGTLAHLGNLQHTGHDDTEIYLGGPPPYLPVLNSSEMAEQEKQRRSPSETREPRSSNYIPPKLTKTVPEITKKIIETRDRIKNETIEWKKKVLYKLEKRLLKKLKRAESVTGEKAEIEDLWEEGPEKRKKSRSTSLDRRSSGAESVTDGITDSVTDSVTDDDDDMHERSDNLSKDSENVKDPGDKLHECSEKDTEDKNTTMEETDNCFDVSDKKCEENKLDEFPCAEEETSPNCESFTRVIKEEKVEKSLKELCQGLEDTLNVDKEESATKVDCVTIERCQVTKLSSEAERISQSETSSIKNANDVQCSETDEHTNTELSESSHKRSPKLLQYNEDEKECLTYASNANEKPAVGRKNLFEAFSSGSQASHTRKEDKARLPETCEESSLAMTHEKTSIPAETKKPDKPAKIRTVKKDVKMFKNLNSLKKRLETCSKEVLKKKTETACCDRNIWAVLQRDGIF